MSEVQQWLEEWREARKRGKRAFIWRFWVCWWGGMMYLVIGWGILIDQFIRGAFHLLPFIGMVPMVLVCGYFVGLLQWKHNERRYASATR